MSTVLTLTGLVYHKRHKLLPTVRVRMNNVDMDFGAKKLRRQVICGH